MIIAAVKAYAVARAGEPERYTMHPANWLRDKRWTDQPATADGGPPIIDGITGEPVAVARPRRESESESWDDLVGEIDNGPLT